MCVYVCFFFPPPHEIEFCKGFGDLGVVETEIEKLRAGFRILN